MKVALICPSNLLYMPYVNSYERLLVEQNIAYDIIHWDRFQMESEQVTCYQDGKVGHQRHFFDYLKYKKFLCQRLAEVHYDRVVVFSIQLAYLLKDILAKAYPGNYIFDIRDYHPLLKMFNSKKLIEQAAYTVISSPGYKKWLPANQQYILHHNTQLTNLQILPTYSPNNHPTIRIANIGAIRDLQINKSFIGALSNDARFELSFHGAGDCNKALGQYVLRKHVRNITLTGKYEASQEASFYEQSDMINILRSNNSVNNQTALPNRLYNAAFYAKPLLALAGSEVADQVAKYQLGLVIRSFEQLGNQLEAYVQAFEQAQYEHGRKAFLAKAATENDVFKQTVQAFFVGQPTGHAYEY